MKLLIDTNVVMDILLKREPFFTDSYQAVCKAIQEKHICYLSTSAVTDIFYILRKALGSKEEARKILYRLTELFVFADVLSNDLLTALSSELVDFEDAIVDTIAVRSKMNYILTRNTKDFAQSKVKAITPGEYLKK